MPNQMRGTLPPASTPHRCGHYDPGASTSRLHLHGAGLSSSTTLGVIIGTDLVYRAEAGWVGDRENSCDGSVKRAKNKFLDLVKNTYRVLLSRGMKGCYVCFLDKETENFFRSRTEVVAPEKHETT